LATSHIFLHSPLSIAFVIHLFTPVLIMLSWTSSNYLFLGLPFLHLPPGFPSSAILGPLWLLILCMWPNHFILDLFIVVTKSRSWYIHLSSWLLLILHKFLSFTGPKVFLRTFLSFPMYWLKPHLFCKDPCLTCICN
jgi:hypothetical protein